MKHCVFSLLTILTAASSMAQNQNSSLQSSYSTVFSQDTESFFNSSLSGSFFTVDKQYLYRQKSILPITNFNSYSFKSGIYWMGSITTQSYNQGKLGTYYMWDVQGNLRESRMFVDVAGKNKRGLKLVFRRR
jgi:hypothetical protein